jgi:hypothetical protein
MTMAMDEARDAACSNGQDGGRKKRRTMSDQRLEFGVQAAESPRDAPADFDETVRNQRQALTRFVVDNRELERLEQLLLRFNIFDAIGVARQELRHSDFLAFLLDPKQPHGLGDAFAKRLIQRALVVSGNDPLPITPIDLDVWSLDRLTVIREWQNIDILLVDEEHQFAVVIENKIGSGEHSDQLAKYLRVVREAHPGEKILGLYLTPDGTPPSDDAYLVLDYGHVADVADTLADGRRTALDPAVHTLITHYAGMLRRHVVADSEIAELCRSIYQKHRQALDLIYEHRPDEQAAIRDVLVSLIDGTPGIVRDDAAKATLRFVPEAWDVPELRAGAGWTPSGRMLLFELRNNPDRLGISLYLGPGPAPVRGELLQVLRDAPHPIKVPANPGPKFSTAYSRRWLSPHDYEDTSYEEREARVREAWQRFIETDVPAIQEALDIPAALPQRRAGWGDHPSVVQSD